MRMRASAWALLVVAAGWAAGCEPASPAKVYELPRVQEEAASMRSPIVNLPAPDFTLTNQEGRSVSLKD